jgi:hypothetical protein
MQRDLHHGLLELVHTLFDDAVPHDRSGEPAILV